MNIIKKKWFVFGAIAIIAVSIIGFSLFHVDDNKSVDSELNGSVKSLVSQMLKVQYKTHDESKLKEIFTKDLQQNIYDYYGGFLREQSFYYISSNYMKTLRYNETRDEWYVILSVYEGFDDKSYLHIGFKQQDDGSYLISFVGKDA